jgi:crotonobetainyl-CoA:carnitine CoA-transferase CaiB-like acyl-CoA transferase
LATLPGYDPLMQAYAGIMSLTGHPDAPPARAGTSIVDMGTGMWAALGVLSALRERDRTGRGGEVTTALFDTALAWIPYQLLGYLGTGEVPRRHGAGAGMIVPYEAFPTRDGQLMIAGPTDALFQKLCLVLGRPDLGRDPRFHDNASRVRHRDTLVPALGEATRETTTAALVDRLRQAGVPCAPIQTVDQVVADPQTRASQMLASLPHPAIPDLQTVLLPWRWNGERLPPRRPPPRVGEDTVAVLSALGFPPGEIGALSARGVVGTLDGEG